MTYRLVTLTFIFMFKVAIFAHYTIIVAFFCASGTGFVTFCLKVIEVLEERIGRLEEMLGKLDEGLGRLEEMLYRLDGMLGCNITNPLYN